MDVLMPQLGETVTEGKIIAWFKAPGDAVAKDDLLFEIETDKTSMEVPSLIAGALQEIRVAQGEVALVGEVVAVIGEGAALTPPPSTPEPTLLEPAPALSAAAPASPGAAAPLDPFHAVRTPPRNYGVAALPGGVRVTPRARRLAAEAGLDPVALTGSGPQGRIVAADVRGPAAAPRGERAGDAAHAGTKALSPDPTHEDPAPDGMRGQIVPSLVASMLSVPHLHLSAEVEIDELLALRARVNAGGGPKVSIHGLLVKAYAVALRRTPAANAVWAERAILRFERADVGVAVAVDGGVYTPVLHAADQKSVSEIAAEIRGFAERARAGTLSGEDQRGGAGTVSNLGSLGVNPVSATPNPPQSSILAVGAAARRPREAEDGGVRFVSAVSVTLSCDRRVVDAPLGAELLSTFRMLVETPLAMLL